MAKRKRSAALFEVFNDNKVASAGLASRPARGWFKARAEPAAGNTATATDPNDPTTGSIRSALIAPRIAAVEAMESAAAASTELERRERIEPIRQRAMDRPMRGESPRFHVDPDTRELTLIIPFTTAIVAVFAIVVIVGLSFVLGHHAGALPAVASTADQTADDGTTGAIQPGALEVPKRAIVGQSQIPAKTTGSRNSDDSKTRDRDSAPRANVPGHVTGNSGCSDVDALDGPWIIGLNYLLVQVYPNLAGATEAREFLLKNGVNCTIEKVPEGFYCPDPTWLAVITTRGFDRDQLHSAEYDAFKHKIETLSDTFSTVTKNKTKHFSLQPYKLK